MKSMLILFLRKLHNLFIICYFTFFILTLSKSDRSMANFIFWPLPQLNASNHFLQNLRLLNTTHYHLILVKYTQVPLNQTSQKNFNLTCQFVVILTLWMQVESHHVSYFTPNLWFCPFSQASNTASNWHRRPFTNAHQGLRFFIPELWNIYFNPLSAETRSLVNLSKPEKTQVH